MITTLKTTMYKNLQDDKNEMSIWMIDNIVVKLLSNLLKAYFQINE